MKTINLNIPVLSLSGEELKENNETITLGRILGNQLVGSSKGDVLKYYDWATKLYKGGEISVDESDLKKIESFVTDSEQLTILVKAQILKELDKI